MRALLLIAILCASLCGQEVILSGPSPRVVRMGEASQLALKIERTNIEMRVEAPKVDGLVIQVGPPQSSAVTQIINGRVTSSGSTTVVVAVRPTRQGKFTVPPFRVQVGNQTLTTKVVELECVKDLEGADRSFLTVKPIADTVYVHEPIRLQIDCGIDDSLAVPQGRIQDGRAAFEINLEAPWLEELVGAVKMTAEEKGERAIGVNDHFTSVHYEAGFQHTGRSYHRFKLERSFLPTAPGKIEIPAALLRYSVQFGPDRIGLFGERVGGDRRSLYAYGEPVSITVKPIPEAGRPKSYAGAVGRFVLEANLDRSQVRVGNSVKLTFTVAGSGNLEFLRVPELDNLPGFHLRGKTEKRTSEQVEVIYDLTPLSVEVKSLPAIPWSYFDTRPGKECYVELTTKELPLKVEPPAEGEGLKPVVDGSKDKVTPGVDDIFDMKSLEGPQLSAPAPVARSWAWAAFLLPWALMLLALQLGRNWLARSQDQRGKRLRGADKRFAQTLANQPLDALVNYLADRLDVAPAAVIEPQLAQRLIDAGADATLAEHVQNAIDQGVAARYGGGGGLSAEQAQSLYQRLAAAKMGPSSSHTSTALLLFLLPWFVAAPAAAQTEPTASAQAAQAAYRAGDYGTAAELYAQAIAAGASDRRLHFNLGNSLFRQGRWAQALWRYECARLAMPRDPELRANRELAARKLDLATGQSEGFGEALVVFAEQWTHREIIWWTLALNALAAGCLILGRSALLRVLGWILLVPALLAALELLWLRPARPAKGIVIAPQAALVAEPREGLEPMAKLREGVTVRVLGEGQGWTKVALASRAGYLRAGEVGVVK